MNKNNKSIENKKSNQKKLDTNEQKDFLNFLKVNNNLDLLDYFDSLKDDDFASINKKEELLFEGDPFANMTHEEVAREMEITNILATYRDLLDDKVKYVSKSKKLILIFLFILLLMLVLGILALIFLSIFFVKDVVSFVVSIVGSCVTLTTSVIVSLRIIIKYTFNEKEDEHISNVLGMILSNDLKRKEMQVDFLKNENNKK